MQLQQFSRAKLFVQRIARMNTLPMPDDQSRLLHAIKQGAYFVLMGIVFFLRNDDLVTAIPQNIAGFAGNKRIGSCATCSTIIALND